MAEKEPSSEYSREAYEEAEQEVEEAKKEISPERPTEKSREAVERKGAIEQERDRLFEISWDEALKLNEEYNGLWKSKGQADKALADFRREKLGMPERAEPEPERTKKSEIKANVEFWQELGVEVDEADVRAKIEALSEKEGFNFYLYLPQGVKASQLIAEMKERFPAWVWRSVGDPDKIKMPRTTKESYAMAARYQQEPDEDSLEENAKSAEDWEKTEDTFMTPAERIVAEMRWHKEKGSHLDEKKYDSLSWLPLG